MATPMGPGSSLENEAVVANLKRRLPSSLSSFFCLKGLFQVLLYLAG